MSSYARIINNTAAEVITPPPGFALADCIHPSLVAQFQPVPDDVLPGATYDAATQTWTNPDTTAVPAPEASDEVQLVAAKTNKLAAINAAANAALSALTVGYPDLEVATWDQQLAEAKLVAATPALAQPLADGASDSIPFLRQLATARESLGATPAERIVVQAAKILANAAAWAAASGAIVGRRLALEDAVDAAATPEDVAAIVVDFGGAA